MLHLPPLPGSPLSRLSPSAIGDHACKEAETYLQVMGEDTVDAFLVENMWDLPYVQPDQMGPETTATMTMVCDRLRREVVPENIPIGVQVLAGANKEAMAVARAAGLQFVRAEGFVFSHIADEGLMNACAGPLLRYRRSIGADRDPDYVSVFCDIKKKHSAHALTDDVSLEETASAARFFGADGVILTGSATGAETDPNQVESVVRVVKDEMPVLVGSGVTSDNVANFTPFAHGLIVGSFFKKEGNWKNELDLKRFQAMAEALKKIDRDA